MKNRLEWANLVLGAWLFLSPWILGFSGTSAAAWSAWVLGALVVILSGLSISDQQRWEDWGNAAVGVIGFLAPWLFGFLGTSVAAWNFWIISLAVVIIAIWAATSPATPKATS